MNEFRNRLFGEDEMLLRRRTTRPSPPLDSLTDLMIGRSEARRHNQRDEAREMAIGEEVTVQRRSRRYRMRLLNLSGGGAMLEGELPPPLYEPLLVELAPGQLLTARLLWQRDGRLGIEFAQETRIDMPGRERSALIERATQRLQAVPAEGKEAASAVGDAAAADPSHNRRDRARHGLIWSATLHYRHDSHAVKLRNISAEGALIEVSEPLVVGSDALLEMDEAGAIFADVVWSAGDQAGLAFRDRFDLSRLAGARARAEPVSARWPSQLGR